jgi:hypothetical protein
MDFTQEEINLMHIYGLISRDALINDFMMASPDFDAEMADMALYLIIRLEKMSDDEFNAAVAEAMPEYES